MRAGDFGWFSFQRISPLSAGYRPYKTFIRVVFPAPFSPSRAWISPCRTSKFTWLLAYTPGKLLSMSTISSRFDAGIQVTPEKSLRKALILDFASNPTQPSYFPQNRHREQICFQKMPIQSYTPTLWWRQSPGCVHRRPHYLLIRPVSLWREPHLPIEMPHLRCSGRRVDLNHPLPEFENRACWTIS